MIGKEIIERANGLSSLPNSPGPLQGAGIHKPKI